MFETELRATSHLTALTQIYFKNKNKWKNANLLALFLKLSDTVKYFYQLASPLYKYLRKAYVWKLESIQTKADVIKVINLSDFLQDVQALLCQY